MDARGFGQESGEVVLSAVRWQPADFERAKELYQEGRDWRVIVKIPSYAKHTRGCPKPSCHVPGWKVDNDVPYGETSVTESSEGWCPEHGEFSWQAGAVKDQTIFWDEVYSNSVEAKARYHGFTVEQFKQMLEDSNGDRDQDR